jgi:hypothetical protein
MGRRVFLLILLTLLVSACRPERVNSGTNKGVDFTSPSGSVSQTASSSKTLDFTAPRLGGGQVVGSEFQSKDVAVWFWAPW